MDNITRLQDELDCENISLTQEFRHSDGTYRVIMTDKASSGAFLTWGHYREDELLEGGRGDYEYLSQADNAAEALKNEWQEMGYKAHHIYTCGDSTLEFLPITQVGDTLMIEALYSQDEQVAVVRLAAEDDAPKVVAEMVMEWFEESLAVEWGL